MLKSNLPISPIQVAAAAVVVVKEEEGCGVKRRALTMWIEASACQDQI